MTNIQKFRNNIQSHIEKQLNDWMNDAPDIVRQSYYEIPVVASTLVIPRLGKIRKFEKAIENKKLLDLVVPDADGSQVKMSTAIKNLNMDAIIVHYDNKIKVEYYAEGKYANIPHLLQSTAKSLVGISYAIAVDKGLIDPQKKIVHYLPQVADSMYEDATVQQLADMRVNTPCNDFYSFKHEQLRTGDSVELMDLSKSTMYGGWGNKVSIMEYVQKYIGKGEKGLLKGHGATFNYFSLGTILMAFVIEATTDEPFHEYFGREVYSKIGAAHDALFTVNSFGEPTGAEGGMSITTMDMLRLTRALQEKAFDSPYLYDHIHTLQADTKINRRQTNMEAFEEYLGIYGKNGISHYSNYFYLAKNPLNGVRINLMLGIYGQIIMYSLEDDFVYVAHSSYNLTTAPPLIAHAQAAFQLHDLALKNLEE